MLGFQEARLLYHIGLMASMRGLDSSGIAFVHRKKNTKFNFHIEKDPVPVAELLSRQSVQNNLFSQGLVAVVGHARATTSGATNHCNAHPIQVNHIIGTHNGTISRFEPSKEERETNSDSRVLFNKISSQGLEKSLDEIYDGAYALAYIDIASRTVNFARNAKRTLYVMHNNAGTTMYWSSEREMLALIKGRESGLFKEPAWLEIDKHYTVDLGSATIRAREIKPKATSNWHEQIERQIHEQIECKVTEVRFCPHCHRESDHCYCQKQRPKPTTTHLPLIKPKEVRTYEIYPYRDDTRKYKGFKGIVASAHQHFKGVSTPCTGCSKPMFPENPFWWFSETQGFCSSCLKDQLLFDFTCTKRLSKGELVGEVNGSIH